MKNGVIVDTSDTDIENSIIKYGFYTKDSDLEEDYSYQIRSLVFLFSILTYLI